MKTLITSIGSTILFLYLIVSLCSIYNSQVRFLEMRAVIDDFKLEREIEGGLNKKNIVNLEDKAKKILGKEAQVKVKEKDDKIKVEINVKGKKEIVYEENLINLGAKV